jgi:hypothetical protein
VFEVLKDLFNVTIKNSEIQYMVNRNSVTVRHKKSLK